MGTVTPMFRANESESTEVQYFEEENFEPKKEAKVTAEGLYQVQDVDKASTVVSTVNRLNQALENVSKAIEDFEDEIEREIQLDLLRDNVFELTLLKDINRNLEDLLAALQVCLRNKEDSPFSRVELVKLRKVIAVTKNNFNMADNILDECLAILDDNFDLSIPEEPRSSNG